MTRKYELKKRAETVEETRRRIVEAAVELHGTVGPARTTVSAIADRAGVQRQTYYRHFPSERELLTACSGLWEEQHPPPDPEGLRALSDGLERLRAGLTGLYAFYEEGEGMLANVVRDAAVHELAARPRPGLHDVAGARAAQRPVSRRGGGAPRRPGRVRYPRVKGSRRSDMRLLL